MAMNPEIFGIYGTLEPLPIEMKLKIFKLLNLPSVKLCRSVCKTWKDLIDQEIPLPVIADDRKEGNSEFLKSVIKKEVYVLNSTKLDLVESLLQPRRPHSLLKLETIGPVHPQFFTKLTSHFGNIHELIIRGKTLLRPMIFNQPVILPRLKILNINAPFSRNHVTPGFVSRSLEILCGSNIMGLLVKIHCPTLETLSIDGDVDQMKLPTFADWKVHALPVFLNRHNKTLKNLLIGESSILRGRYETRKDEEFPTNLKSLHFSFHTKVLQPCPPPSCIDYCQVLMRQTELENLNVGLLWYPFPQDVLSRLPVTMKTLAVYWNIDMFGTLDAGIFSKLVNLERLELTFDGSEHETTLTNFDKLKFCKKLKALVCEQLAIPSQELESIPSYFPTLQMLYLYRCKHKFSDPGDLVCGISQRALTSFFNLRKLDYLYIYTEDFIGDASTRLVMKNLISKIARREKKNGYFIGEEPDYSRSDIIARAA